jgi:RES domain-containing protein
MQRDQPVVSWESALMRTVEGSFYRAVDPAYRDAALAGSRSAGRYSPPDVPTLYLSSSPEGVAAAMIAHTDDRTPDPEVLQFNVEANWNAHGAPSVREVFVR